MARLIYIADVYCPWCYGFAPIMGKLAADNPELPVKVFGGSLIPRLITLKEDAASQPGLIDFWRRVERMTGRSLEGAIRAVETGANVRLYSPGADEILAILAVMAPGHELAQLFELEDMFYGQGLDLFTDQSLGKIAAAWKISASSLEKAMEEKVYQEAAEKKLEDARGIMGEIDAYPSVFLESGGKLMAVSRGYVHYETALSRLNDVKHELGLTGLHSRKGGGTLHVYNSK